MKNFLLPLAVVVGYGFPRTGSFFQFPKKGKGKEIHPAVELAKFMDAIYLERRTSKYDELNSSGIKLNFLMDVQAEMPRTSNLVNPFHWKLLRLEGRRYYLEHKSGTLFVVESNASRSGQDIMDETETYQRIPESEKQYYLTPGQKAVVDGYTVFNFKETFTPFNQVGWDNETPWFYNDISKWSIDQPEDTDIGVVNYQKGKPNQYGGTDRPTGVVKIISYRGYDYYGKLVFY